MAIFGNRSVTSTYDKDKLKRLTAAAPAPIQTQAINSPTRGGFQGGANAVSNTFGYDPLYTQELQGLKGMDKGPKGKGIIGSFFGRMKDGSTFIDRLSSAAMAAGGDMGGAVAMRNGITNNQRAEQERLAGVERLQQLTAGMSPEMQNYARLDPKGFMENYGAAMQPRTDRPGDVFNNPLTGERRGVSTPEIVGGKFGTFNPATGRYENMQDVPLSAKDVRDEQRLDSQNQRDQAYMDRLAAQTEAEKRRVNYTTSKPYFAPPRARGGGGSGGRSGGGGTSAPPPF